MKGGRAPTREHESGPAATGQYGRCGTLNHWVRGSNPWRRTTAMSRDTVDRCLGTSLDFRPRGQVLGHEAGRVGRSSLLEVVFRPHELDLRQWARRVPAASRN